MTDDLRSSFVCGNCGLEFEGAAFYANWCPDCDEFMTPVNGPFRDGKVWVLTRKCPTCVFRPGNLMHLSGGRLDAMVKGCVEENRIFSCHSTLDGPRSVCRGLYDLHRDDILVLRMAEVMDMLAFDDPPEDPHPHLA